MAQNQAIQEFTWDSFLSLLKESTDELSFNTWIQPLSFFKINGNILYIAAPSKFIKNWVEANYKEKMLLTILDKYSLIKGLEIVVASFNDEQKPSTPAKDSSNIEDAEENVAEPTSSNSLEIILNSNYKFKTFVVGPPNEFAYNVAKKVALEEKVPFNPLFIYGGVGLGKTHLMHSIAWSLKENFKKKDVLYLTAEKFMTLYITALRDQNMISFKEMFRSTDVLMIDDFQFIAGKEGTQQEFFHTFNELISQGKQIVLSADKSPSDLDKIEERILSRLKAGISANISATTYELRMGILESKAEQFSIKIPKEVLSFLANTITSNIRELEGGLNRIITYHQTMAVKIDLNMAMAVLEDILKHHNKTASVELIQKKVAEFYHIKLSDMNSIKRDTKMVSTRKHIAMYIAKQITNYSLVEIGKKFGGKDHTTVLYAVKKIETAIKKDANLEEEIRLLINIIQKS